MHGFVARIDTTAPETRLARLDAQGWQVAPRQAQLSLATIGLGQSRQVTHTIEASAATGGAVILGLVWLANRAEICARLGIAPDAAPEQDIELVARLWQAEGAGFAQRLNGGFSLLIYWPGSGQAECYRDPFGMFPFYYVWRAGALTCGSDLRAVLHLSDAPLEADLLRLADFIVGEEIDRFRTAFAEVRRLPAAHKMRVLGQKSPVQERYWSLPDPETLPLEAAVEGFKDPLAMACAACVGRPGHLGAMLSGGLDSTTLAGLAAQQLAAQEAAPLPTLSFTYPGKAYDESAYIDAADAAFFSRPNHIPITAAPDLRDMPKVVEDHMDLFLAYGLQKSREIYHAGQARGLTHMIDGHGGDEVVSHGYGRLIELAVARKWRTLLREARGAAKVHGSSLLQLYLLLVARYGGLRRGGLPRRVLMGVARRLRRLEQVGDPVFDGASLLSETLRAHLKLEQAPRYGQAPGNGESRDALLQQERFEHRRNLQSPIVEHAFEVLFRAAGVANILPLYPFFDQRVVRFCLALPSAAKLNQGQTRWIMREGLKDVLPEKVRTRSTKADFGPEFRESVHALAQNAPVFGAEDAGRDRLDLLDKDAIAALQRRVGQDGHTAPDALRAYWRLVVLRDWLAASENWAALQSEGQLI